MRTSIDRFSFIRVARRVRTAVLLSLLAAALAAGAPTTALAIAGKGGKFEFAIDAPWRMEPSRDSSGNVSYGPIPIQITIHDAVFSPLDESFIRPGPIPMPWTSTHNLGRFLNLIVTQIDTAPGRTARTYSPVQFGVRDLDVIERTTGVWPHSGSDACLPYPSTRVCDVWADPACAGEGQWIRGTSEWHAIFFYTPQGTPAPGTTVHLQITAKVSREEADLPWTGGSTFEVSLDNVTDGLELEEDQSGLLTLVNEVAVYLGDEPLPRFGNGWLYGDLHYHAQGTDNEGESAYNYRGVIEAVGAIGLDFVFATEHASNSEQIVDADSHLIPPGVDTDRCGLRDMSPTRYASLLDALHKNGGVNRTVMNRPTVRLPQSYLSHKAVPQVFLGGEVDVIPELAVEELISPPPGEIETYVDPLDHETKTRAKGFTLAFGDGLRLPLPNLCGGQQGWPFGSSCNVSDLMEPFEGTYLVRDNQGLNDWYHSRQHLIYLPGRHDTVQAFVSSNTEAYGGGSRLLFRTRNAKMGVAPEIEQKEGWFFLAHPLDSAGKGTPGPELVPYSEYQLRAVMQSSAFLGLQFWNEDVRVRSDALDGPPPMSNRSKAIGTADFPEIPDGRDEFGWEDGYFSLTSNDAASWNPVWQEGTESRCEGKLYHGAYLWDRMLLWGLGMNPWFSRGCEPRKVFMAGGSDAHGDFNYRREGYFHGTDGITDAAIGKPRNLVHVGEPDGEPIPNNDFEDVVPHSQEQIIEAIRHGNFCVTDGPAFRIAMDMNSSGSIDVDDVPMGGVHYYQGGSMTLLIEWKSTPEFGTVDEVQVCVGAGSSQSCAGIDRNCPEYGVVYAPGFAGPHNYGDDLYPTPGPEAASPGIYRIDETLRITQASLGRPLGHEGTALLTLATARFPLANGKPADRFYVRAFARTLPERCQQWGNPKDPLCQPRFAYTNPIWGMAGAVSGDLEPQFRRGDANGDGVFDLSDPLSVLSFLFLGGAASDCQKAADSDDNGVLEITDATRALGHLFIGAAPPPPPFSACGKDPTADSLTCRSPDSCAPVVRAPAVMGGAVIDGARAAPPPANCLPDLVAGQLTADGPIEPGGVQGFTVPVRLSITNGGAKLSGPFKVTFNNGDGSAAVASIDAGATRAVIADVKFPESSLGKVTHLKARIDTVRAVEESNEDNNESAPLVVDFPDVCETDLIEDPPHPPVPVRYCYDVKPDLVAVELKVMTRIQPAAGRAYSVRLQVTVRNQSQGAAGAFQVALRSTRSKNLTLATPWSIGGLAKDETKKVEATVEFPVTEFKGKTESIFAYADPASPGAPAGAVGEENESNNSSPVITITFP